MGPHPAVAEVRLAVRRAIGGLDSPVLVACSGGADSLALAAAVAFEAPRAGVAAGLVTIDHGLQHGSAAQAASVAAIGYELGLDPVHNVRVDVGRRGGPEAAARAARYRAIDAVAEPIEASVLLGHTLDDQAETVLLGLGRGSGPNSIAGMRTVDGRYRRPLLDVRRDVTRQACAALGLEPWDDPHNHDKRYRRVRVRAEVLPLLEDVLDSGVARALARTARLLRADSDALAEIASRTLDGMLAQAPNADRARALAVPALSELPAAIRSRVLKSWLERAGAGPLTAERVDAVDALITSWRGQAGIELPGGFTVRRTSGTLCLEPVDPA